MPDKSILKKNIKKVSDLAPWQKMMIVFFNLPIINEDIIDTSIKADLVLWYSSMVFENISAALWLMIEMVIPCKINAMR